METIKAQKIGMKIHNIGHCEKERMILQVGNGRNLLETDGVPLKHRT